MTAPDMLVAVVHAPHRARLADVARVAAIEARKVAPKLSGASARRFEPVSGDGWYGIHWADAYVWYQNQGIRAFTMGGLAGKTIPMWIDDPTGRLQRDNPHAKIRRTASGKVQVLIFRRAASMGATKVVMRRVGGVRAPQVVPASYPGAPGRIAIREAGRPLTAEGRRGGQIARTNVGVRWRHPGLQARHFLEQGLHRAAARYHLRIAAIYVREDGRMVEAA